MNVKRDVFARGEYVRRAIEGHEHERCRWCGRAAIKYHPLYRVRWESDSRPGADKFVGAYCSWACFADWQNVTLPGH